MSSNINERIKTIRVELGFTQQAFADQIGISRAHCANIENNRVTVTDSLIKLIALKFAINYDWLLTGEGEKNKEFKEESSEKLLNQYNEMRVIFEKKLSACDSNELSDMIFSFSYFTSVMTALDRLSLENREICNHKFREIFDNLEKLIFRFCLAKERK